MKRLLFSALLLSTPVAAQETLPPAPAPAAAAEAVDPARLALAATTVDFIWPLGTYARMMGGNMQQMVEQMTASMFDMKIGEMVGDLRDEDGKPMDREVAEATLREALATTDPHFEERMRITNRIMMEEMVPVMTRVEPAVRSGLAAALARRFTAAQLAELNAFFATPTGRVYASESMMLWVDAEVVKAMSGMMPELMKEMPLIMQKVQGATAHLPLPRPPRERRRDRRRR